MRVFIIILTVVYFYQTSVLQNLVPNPGFDTLYQCPYGRGQIDFAVFWKSATTGTPDLYNQCSSIANQKVPAAGISASSFQVQRSGGGYAAIRVYYNGGNSTGNSDYLMCKLIEPLRAGQTYYLEFYVSPDFTPDHGDIFTGDVGLALSDTLVSVALNATEALNLNPVIEHTGTVIKDTVAWTRISGCHTAKGDEVYAIIGNFKNTNNTNVEVVHENYPQLNHFYIEDVLLVPFDPLPDTLLLCEGLPLELNGSFRDAAYQWSTGAMDSVIIVTESGLYTVDAIMDNCILSDTVRVIEVSSEVAFPLDTQVCEGPTTKLVAPIPGAYEWSDGSENSEILLTETGFYSLTVTNECGQFTFETYAEVQTCDCNFFVPSAFSPNDDGINDRLEVYSGCDFDYDIRTFEVYNRWGQRVYESIQGQPPSWDGVYRGKRLDEGIYVWKLDAEIFDDKDESTRQILSGDILLSR